MAPERIHGLDQLVSHLWVMNRAGCEAQTFRTAWNCWEVNGLHVNLKQSARIYEAMGNIMLSSQARLWSSPTVKKNYLEHQEGLRNNIKTWLPEILQLPNNKYQSVLAICSFDFWYRLRYHQKQSANDCTDLLIELVENLIS